MIHTFIENTLMSIHSFREKKELRLAINQLDETMQYLENILDELIDLRVELEEDKDKC